MNCAKALSAQLLALPLAILCAALIHASAVFGAEPKTPQKFALTSTAFQAGAEIPRKYTCDGEDVSPPLRWQNAPAGTQAFALIVDDPDAPGGPWVHWVIYDLPATTTELAEASVKTDTLANGAKQGTNDFRNVGYGGPCPPPGPAHRYYFKLYALDAPTHLKPRATKQQVLDALKGHVLGEAELMGHRKR
jgi:Raf kinase inhibitor-like YbhB/YbcL family protein